MTSLRYNQAGISVLAILIIVIGVALLIGGGFLLLNQERAHTRDARRVSDMTRIQAAFELMYNEQASYAGAAINGCAQAGALVSTCNLASYVPTISKLTDPGKYQYVVSVVPTDETYQVTFTLEKDYETLKAGKHTVSPQGVK